MELNLYELNVRSCKYIFYYEFPKESQLAFNLLEMPRNLQFSIWVEKWPKENKTNKEEYRRRWKLPCQREIECLESILPNPNDAWNEETWAIYILCFINLRSIVSCQIPQLLNPYLESLLQVMQWMQIPLPFRILRFTRVFQPKNKL